MDGKEVQAHVYEYTTQLSIDSELKFKGLEKGIVPTQIVFCLKERSGLPISRFALAITSLADENETHRRKEDQLAQMALQRLLPHAPAERCRPPRRRHKAWPKESVQPVEDI